MDMHNRLNIFIKHTGLSIRKFAKTVEIAPQSLSSITGGKNTLSYKLVKRILILYPQLNIRWLFLGEGEMLFDMPESDLLSKDEASINEMRLRNEFLEKALKDKDDTIKALKMVIDSKAK